MSSSSSSSNPSAPTSSSPQHSSCEIANEGMAKKGASHEKDCCHEAASAAASADSRFSCNICFDEVQEPVVTRCGHLYCWQCLFQWLEPGMRPEERESLGMSSFRYGGTNPSRRVCPVCKSECPLSGVVPVYVRSSSSPSKSNSKRSEPISEPSSKNQTMEENENEADTGGIDLDEPENDSNLNAPDESEIMASNEGLRQRRTNRASNDSNNSSNESAPLHVPNRPSVTYPEEPSSPPMSRRSSPISSPRPNASTDNPYRAGAVQITPRSPNGHNGSLTYGILSSLQRATAEYYRNNNNMNNNNNNTDDERDRRRIPSLHDRRNPLSNHNADGSGRFGESPHSYSNYDERHGMIDSETTATQYLSRLLIMLASFVIFCFLMV